MKFASVQKHFFKKDVSVSLLVTAILFLSASQLNAQQSNVGTVPEEKQKIFVNVKISPSSAGFRAGVARIDSAENKFRLWVTNSEERRFTVTIEGSMGFLWNRDFKDAFFDQVFDLSTSDDGNYIIKVSSEKERFEKKIVLSTNSYTRRELSIL